LNIGGPGITGACHGVGECVVGDEFEGFIEDESLFELATKTIVQNFRFRVHGSGFSGH
jgi:hypothetical protein